MSDRYSTRPPKPFPDFPLFAHNNRQWCRKIAGKLRSFGPWDDWKAALERHNREYPFLKAGVAVPDSFEGLTVDRAVNGFIHQKTAEQAAGQISSEWLRSLTDVGKFITANIQRTRPVESLGPKDFEKLRLAIVGKFSPIVARNYVSRIKSIFGYAYQTRAIAKPVDFGVTFKPPTRALIRKHRKQKPKALWTPAQVKALIRKASPGMRAMILLAINCGLNNSDLRNLPRSAVDFKSGWLDFPRAKTFIDRRVKLWPETIEAVRRWLKVRPEPHRKDHKTFLFITRWGNQWDRTGIGHEFDKLMTDCDFDVGSFIWFRKTVQTIGERTGDIIAVRHVMGHVDDSMSADYRQEVDPARIVRVTDCIHEWLYPPDEKPKRKARAGKGGAK